MPDARAALDSAARRAGDPARRSARGEPHPPGTSQGEAGGAAQGRGAIEAPARYDDTLRPEFQAIVACHAKYLRDRPSARISLEGNTDERGSREYNLGLGERRGNSVSSALQANGGSGSQVTVVSYGEERPVCRQHDESCWSKNRRVEIIYTAK